MEDSWGTGSSVYVGESVQAKVKSQSHAYQLGWQGENKEVEKEHISLRRE